MRIFARAFVSPGPEPSHRGPTSSRSFYFACFSSRYIMVLWLQHSICLDTIGKRRCVWSLPSPPLPIIELSEAGPRMCFRTGIAGGTTRRRENVRLLTLSGLFWVVTICFANWLPNQIHRSMTVLQQFEFKLSDISHFARNCSLQYWHWLGVGYFALYCWFSRLWWAKIPWSGLAIFVEFFIFSSISR